MKNKMFIIMMIMMCGVYLYSAPPNPESKWQDDQSFIGVSENFGKTSSKASDTIRGGNKDKACGMPDSVLVLRCEFNDVKFDLDENYPPGNPDTIPHDEVYFERLLYHMSSYWRDVSHGHYDLTLDNFYIYPEVFTLNENMGYYGDDDLSSERVAQMLVELLEMGDAELDYSDYDSYIIFHAGAGQEADVSGENEEDLWTTYVTRKSLQDGLDPDNDEFPGLEFDGKYLKEFVLLPETERQPDITSGDPIFGMLGVMCHEFGRQMGLPTLYDNQSSNGKSAGIGNYGVMGTGLWNAAGFVPPLPCAWSRIYMGWEIENLGVIDSNADALALRYSLEPDGENNTIYRILISEDEYFLLENRRQNPDGSTFVNSSGDTLATFTFDLMDNQQYYEPGHAYAGQPFFNFMENSYENCEWDFYLPGYGEGDALDLDGSGICIWHVDELVMAAKFNIEEEINVPNGDETHKAIDLEEADKDQGMDLYGYYGTMYDTYRAGNNDYFGYETYKGLPWSPTAESYYGGIQLAINDISPSDSVMTFSVIYEWSLDGGYNGQNTYPAAFLDYDYELDALFYPMPNGKLCLWVENVLIHEEELSADTLIQCWSWDDINNRIYIPGQTGNVAMLYLIEQDFSYVAPELFINWEWASPVVITENEKVILGFNSTLGDSCMIVMKDIEGNETNRVVINGVQLTTNLMAEDEILMLAEGEEFHYVIIMDFDGNYTSDTYISQIAYPDFKPEYALYYSNTATERSGIVITTSSNIWIRLERHQEGDFVGHYIEDIPFIVDSYPSLADINGDGKPEYLCGGENSFFAVDYWDNIWQPSNELALPDSSGLMAGVVAIDNGNDIDIIGLMSQKRIAVWENVSNNNFKLHREYPISYGTQSRNYPILHNGTIYIAADNGKIYRDQTVVYPNQTLATEYVNLRRSASIFYEDEENEFESSGLFVEEETYVYPNPYSRINAGAISKGVTHSGKIAVRIMITDYQDVIVKVFDIAGNQVFYNRVDLYPYTPEVCLIDAEKLSSGVYFVKLEGWSETKILKFGIEK